MKLVFMGTPKFSVPALRALDQSKHQICAVYSQPPRPSGRGKKLNFSYVHKEALDLGLTVHTPRNFKSEKDLKIFRELKADIAVVVAYGLILPNQILSSPKFGCVNIHASLLPRWRGAAPIQRAIMEGDDETGICIMKMDNGLDTGPVLSSRKIQITENDTAKILSQRLSLLGSNLIVEVLDKLSDYKAQMQSTVGITYASKIHKSEAKIDWSLPAQTIDRKIRALSPFPGAWTEINGERVKLLASKVVDEEHEAGMVLDSGFSIACGQKAIEITEAQRPGKSAQKSDVFLRGFRLQKGRKLD
jgi:methionyl-tRNA formyltransferase